MSAESSDDPEMLGPLGPRNLDEILGLERVEPAPADERRDRWLAWLKQIDKDLSDLHIARMAWRGLTTIWRDRQPPLPPSFVFDVWAHNYAHAQAAGIRRQADKGRRNVSLYRLLGAIVRHPDRLSLEYYVGLYPWGMQHIGRRAFDQLDPHKTGHIDPALAAADQKSLEEVTSDVVHWTHENVAHLAELPAASVPTFDELDLALDKVGEIYIRWNRILRATDIISLEPVPQYNWQAPLQMPWILGAD